MSGVSHSAEDAIENATDKTAIGRRYTRYCSKPPPEERLFRPLQVTMQTKYLTEAEWRIYAIDSDNGLSPGRRQAIIWPNAGILLIGPLGTYFSEILIEIHTFSFKKMYLKMSSGKRRPSCFGLNVIYSARCSVFDRLGQRQRQMGNFGNDVVITLAKVPKMKSILFNIFCFHCQLDQLLEVC